MRIWGILGGVGGFVLGIGINIREIREQKARRAEEAHKHQTARDE
jgi:hypothetical protein